MTDEVRPGDVIPSDCPYCYHGGRCCSERKSPDHKWYCTKEKGHRDDHVACATAMDEHCLARWVNILNDDEEPKFHPIWVPDEKEGER